MLRGALAQRGDHVVRILGRRGQAGVLEAVDARLQAAADFLRAVRVRDHRQLVRVRLVDDGLHFGIAHLVLVDQLDHVDAGLRPACAPWRAHRAGESTPQRNSSVPG